MKVKEMSELENLKMNYDIQATLLEELEDVLKVKEQENKILKKALEIMLDELKGYARMVLEDYIVDSFTIEDFIEPAKESINDR